MEKLRPMWEDTIKIDLQTKGWGVDYIDGALYRHRWQAVVSTARKTWSP